jgi:hypothetical protein
MSFFNFNGKALEMIMQEANLAAIMIQHTFRAYRNYLFLKNAVIKSFDGFGTQQEIKAARMSVVNARSFELRAKWRSMHWTLPDKRRSLIGGLRGPAHMAPVYTGLALDIVLHMITEKAEAQTHGNREDIVRSHG